MIADMPKPHGYLFERCEFMYPDMLDQEVKDDPATIAVYTAEQMAAHAQQATRQAMEQCDHLQLLFNASKLGHEQAFASSQRAHSALSALQRDLNIMLASAVPEGGEWVEGYRIKTGALHRIIGTMQEAGYSVVLPTLPPPPDSVSGEE